jgi:hypothetical protein
MPGRRLEFVVVSRWAYRLGRGTRSTKLRPYPSGSRNHHLLSPWRQVDTQLPREFLQPFGRHTVSQVGHQVLLEGLTEDKPIGGKRCPEAGKLLDLTTEWDQWNPPLDVGEAVVDPVGLDVPALGAPHPSGCVGKHGCPRIPGERCERLDQRAQPLRNLLREWSGAEPVAVRAEIGDLREEARRLRALTRKAIEELRASGHRKKAADLERELLEGGSEAVRPGDPADIL